VGQDHNQNEKKHGLARRILVTVVGLALCVAGVGLLILPGPGLLLLLAGLVLLANEYPWARRMTAPVRRQAIRSAEQSVASPLRISVTALCGLALVAAGIAWILVPSLPFGGVATGSSLIVSGILVLALLVYSYRRFRRSDDSSGESVEYGDHAEGIHSSPVRRGSR
jgi:membrane protein implicated in regulation of membrane protease activity